MGSLEQKSKQKIILGIYMGTKFKKNSKNLQIKSNKIFQWSINSKQLNARFGNSVIKTEYKNQDIKMVRKRKKVL